MPLKEESKCEELSKSTDASSDSVTQSIAHVTDQLSLNVVIICLDSPASQLCAEVVEPNKAQACSLSNLETINHVSCADVDDWFKYNYILSRHFYYKWHYLWLVFLQLRQNESLQTLIFFFEHPLKQPTMDPNSYPTQFNIYTFQYMLKIEAMCMSWTLKVFQDWMTTKKSWQRRSSLQTDTWKDFS